MRGRRPEPLDDMAINMAAGPGFEPGQHDPESWVLPLHNPAIWVFVLTSTNYYNPIFSIVKVFCEVCDFENCRVSKRTGGSRL